MGSSDFPALASQIIRTTGRRHPLSEKKIMYYMYQLCKSLDHMHRNGIFHRDVKPENILIKQDVLKLGDFGSCRSVYSKQPYTEYISTRWYRAPECLLTDGFYTYKMDLWSAGCVFYEIASLRPLFPGANELDQISKIHDVIGTPAQKTLTKFKQDQEYLYRQPICPRNASPSCMQWWPMILMRESLPIRPCSIPTSKNRETVPKARGGPSQETRTGLHNGTAQTKAFRSVQTVILLQPHTAVSVWIWNKWKSPGVEALEVCWYKQEDRSTEGHETCPETVSLAHHREERWRVLSSLHRRSSVEGKARCDQGQPGQPGLRESAALRTGPHYLGRSCSEARTCLQPQEQLYLVFQSNTFVKPPHSRVFISVT
ncbi:MAPK/MAK/MRK overlapping kinase isoform X3 [Nycticebus coucang]|uniref:MAPK/MAK/MRK overlapping kinase isoform X3 n=1 Tax=Nycticebus coucang TaxID=9470 RepID=UPI00234D62F1|nr:MAPK/MAK/MRK overlapping kinase isoform X3 [Nycticebus coucang]